MRKRKKRNIIVKYLQRADLKFAELDKFISRKFEVLRGSFDMPFKFFIANRRTIISGISGLAILIVGLLAGSFIGTKGLVEVRSNSPEISVSFKGDDIAISPNKVWLDNVTAGTSVEQCIYVTNKGNEAIVLMPFASPGQNIIFEVESLRVPAKSKARLCAIIDIPQDAGGKDFEILVGVKGIDGHVNMAVCSKFFIKVE